MYKKPTNFDRGKCMSPNAIIVDLDGTLSNDELRSHFVTNGNRDFKAYHAHAVNDSRFEFCYEIVKRFITDTMVIFITGRPEAHREMTVDWLKQQCGIVAGYQLIMRPDDLFIKNYLFKQNVFNDHIKNKYNVLFAIDDLKDVCDMWQQNGIMAINCFTRN